MTQAIIDAILNGMIQPVVVYLLDKLHEKSKAKTKVKAVAQKKSNSFNLRIGKD